MSGNNGHHLMPVDFSIPEEAKAIVFKVIVAGLQVEDTIRYGMRNSVLLFIAHENIKAGNGDELKYRLSILNSSQEPIGPHLQYPSLKKAASEKAILKGLKMYLTKFTSYSIFDVYYMS